MKEIDLVDKIAAYLEKYHIRYSREARMGIGVPDIVINLGASKSIIKITDYYVLALAEHVKREGRISLEEAKNYISFDQQRFKSIINYAVENRVLSIKNGYISCDKKVFDLNLGIAIAIEVKLSKWQNGLLQAQRYMSFANYSYLALPDSKIRNVDVEMLKDMGIGLLSISERGPEEILKPCESQIYEYKQKYILTSSTILEGSVQRKRDYVFSALLNA